MEIVIHGHQTDLTPTLKLRAQDSVRKISGHLPDLLAADVRFLADGVSKAVEIVVHAPRNTRLVAKAESKYHETALADAVAKLDQQIRKLKASQKKKVHQLESPA